MVCHGAEWCVWGGLQEKALSHSEELFDSADVSKDGRLQLSEVRDILRKSSKEYSHFAEHARFLDGCALLCTVALFLAHSPFVCLGNFI